MISDPKTLGDMALNISMTCSFAIPGVGAEVAGGIAVTQFFFDMFFPEQPPDPSTMLPTNADLKEALQDLQKRLKDDDWEKEKARQLLILLGEDETMGGYWEDWSNPPPKSDVDNAKRFKDNLDKYFDNKDTEKALEDVRRWVESAKTGHRTQTFELYSLAGSLHIAFHKFALIWQYNQALFDREDQHNRHVASKKAYYVWDRTDPGIRPSQPPEVVEDRAPVDRDEYIKDNLHAQHLVKYANLHIGYASSLHKAMTENRQDAETKSEQRMAKIVPMDDGSGNYWCFDGETGAVSARTRIKDIRDIDLEALQGAAQAAVWDRLMKQYGIDEVDEDSVDQFGATIENWKKAVSHVTVEARG